MSEGVSAGHRPPGVPRRTREGIDEIGGGLERLAVGPGPLPANGEIDEDRRGIDDSAALAKAVHRRRDPSRSGVDGGEGGREGEAPVVVQVDLDRNRGVRPANRVHPPRHLGGLGDTGRVGVAEAVGPGGGGGGVRRGPLLLLGATRVLQCEPDSEPARLRVRDRPLDLPHEVRKFLPNASDPREVVETEEEPDPAGPDLRDGVHVRLERAGVAKEARSERGVEDGADPRALGLADRGMAAFDGVDPEGRERPRDRNRGLGGPSNPERLSPFAERRVDDSNGFVTHVESVARGTARGEGSTLLPGTDPKAILTRMRERKRRDESTDRAAEALRESERRLKTLMDNLPGMAYRCVNAPEWPMHFVSEGCFDLTGYAPAELTVGGGIDYGDLIHPDDRQAVYDAVQEAVRNGTSFRMEYRIVKKSGEIRDVWEQGRLVSEPGDPTEWLEGFITDVTESKRGRYSTALLARITETSPIGIALLDPDGRMTFANAAAVEILGLEGEQLAGRRYDEFPWKITDAAGEPLPDEEVPFVRVLRTGRTVQHAEVGLRRADRRILLSVNAAPLDDGSGKIAGVVVLFRDVTQERETERQLLQAQKMEAVGRLAGGVAHDFNNLLTAIQGYAEMLAPHLAPGSSADRYLAEIRKAAAGAGELTKQLLAFGRKQILQPSVLDLNAVVDSMMNLIRRVIGENVELVRSLDPSLSAVRADRGQLEQVLMNLCINARDAMPDGGRLTIETSGVMSEGRKRVRLQVSDTGVGMTPEVQARIFEPFFSTKPPEKGTGLGLATVYGIVQQSGGDVRVESAPGAGTRFEIVLPGVEAEASRDKEPVAADDDFAAHGETVLVVEDEDAIRDLLRDVLTDWGYTVLEAGTPRDALAVLTRHEGAVDLLLTDVVLPEMGGPQLATRVETLRPGIRVLFMSGYTDDAVLRHGVLGESARFLAKPFTPAALKRKVREVLEG